MARQVCLAASSDITTNNDGLGRILAFLRIYFAPNAVGSAHQEEVRPPQFKRTDPAMDGNIAEFDLLRRKAASKAQMLRVAPNHMYPPA